MNNGIWQIDGDRRTQLSSNPDALNPRTIERVTQTALADVQASREEAQAICAWFNWALGLIEYGGTDATAQAIIRAVRDGSARYAESGAPRTVPTVQAPDDPGEQEAF